MINNKGHQRAIACKLKSDDDDFLDRTSEDESDKSCPDGVIKFCSMKEEDEWKVYLLDTQYGVRKARTKRERGYKNIPKTKNENVEDDDDEEVDESAEEKKEEDGGKKRISCRRKWRGWREKNESAEEKKEGDAWRKSISTEDKVKLVEKVLTDHQLKVQFLGLILMNVTTRKTITQTLVSVLYIFNYFIPQLLYH